MTNVFLGRPLFFCIAFDVELTSSCIEYELSCTMLVAGLPRIFFSVMGFFIGALGVCCLGGFVFELFVGVLGGIAYPLNIFSICFTVLCILMAISVDIVGTEESIVVILLVSFAYSIPQRKNEHVTTVCM